MPIQFGQLFVPAGAVNPAWTCFGRVHFDSAFSGEVTVSTSGGSGNPTPVELTIKPVDQTKVKPEQTMGYFYDTAPVGTWLLRIDGEIEKGETKSAEVSIVTGTQPGVVEQKIKFL